MIKYNVTDVRNSVTGPFTAEPRQIVYFVQTVKSVVAIPWPCASQSNLSLRIRTEARTEAGKAENGAMAGEEGLVVGTVVVGHQAKEGIIDLTAGTDLAVDKTTGILAHIGRDWSQYMMTLLVSK